MNKKSNPCTDNLTDEEYLTHMIPHHQVAIDMSIELQKNTKKPNMIYLSREIIRKQGYEIWEMEMIKKNIQTNYVPLNSNNNIYPSNELNHTNSLNYTLFTNNNSNVKNINNECNPLFFDPEAHKKHMKNMIITDKRYLQHMIPHHQVAINMSKRLLLYTNNSYLRDFCYQLIINQQAEIFYMKSLLKDMNMYESNEF
jgi:uncharacterized protein (DUF305 family)